MLPSVDQLTKISNFRKLDFICVPVRIHVHRRCLKANASGVSTYFAPNVALVVLP